MKLLTPTQYAEKVGVDRATVYRWIASGKITPEWEIIRVPKIPANTKHPKSDVKQS